jgi:hypothetical protein
MATLAKLKTSRHKNLSGATAAKTWQGCVLIQLGWRAGRCCWYNESRNCWLQELLSFWLLQGMSCWGNLGRPATFQVTNAMPRCSLRRAAGQQRRFG